MNIRLLKKTDIAVIVNAFKESGWQIKPASVFEQYLDGQEQDKRICLVAFFDSEFAGCVTLKWQSDYKFFADDIIPEISDLNVLPNFRNKGVGSELIAKCEKYAAERSNIVGIGVGLYPDYGSAQRLYIKRGYIPGGHGATYNYKYVTPGKEYLLDDDLVLWLTKKLIKNEY
jgi:GNAT superfamily N-acetyltransferase